MSALEFQKALAYLIRFPERPTDEILGDFIGALSDQEETQLRSLANDPLVSKYGKKMQYVRHREAMAILRFSREVIPPRILDALYFEYFEPTRKTTDAFWLGVEFLDFVLSESACANEVARGAPRWAIDCLKYECAKAFVTRHVPKQSDSTLPSNSALCYREFRTLSLQYDIPAFETAWVQTGVLPSEPVERPVTLLFLPSHESPFYRMFEIDGDVEAFLISQRENPPSVGGSLPPYYEAMRSVGLVH